jgi:hypothetical protein
VFTEAEPGRPFDLHAVHYLKTAPAQQGPAGPTHSEGVR